MTLSAQDNDKLRQQLKRSFKRTIKWNKYHQEPTLQTRNQYLTQLIDASFQRVNILFVLLFENYKHQKTYKQYYLPAVESKDNNVMIDGKTFLINQ